MGRSRLGLIGLLSFWLGLSLACRLAAASARTAVHLLLMGWLLTPNFGWNSPALVALLAMLFDAGHRLRTDWIERKSPP
ncbi:MAG: hypothetical protein GWP91_12255 [Rhodobacterales bacterium]|nr:hypothetical protein [Rhodobacterales bacterium]